MDYTYVTTIDNIGNFFEDLEKCSTVSLDTETTGLDHFKSTLILIQAEINNHVYLFDCRKLGDRFTTYIVSLINASKKLCIFHNAKFDIKELYVKTGEMLTNVYDTMVAETLLYQGLGRAFYAYAELVDKYCTVSLDKSVRETFIDMTGQVTMEQLIYSILDVQYLAMIRFKQLLGITQSHQEKVLDLECKLLPVVADMEITGVYIDVDYWKTLEETARQKAKEYKELIVENILKRLDYSKYATTYEVATALSIPVKTKKLQKELESIDPIFGDTWLKENFNVASNKQMKTVLNLFGIDVSDTNEKTLKEYKGGDELIQLLLSFRENEKKADTFGEGYLRYVNPLTNRIHAEYNQLGTYTGRFSVSNPGLHQIPRDPEYRKAFRARPGYKIIGADFSQQEYRLVGAISGEPEIINAYLNGMDMHALTGSIIYGIPIEEVNKQQRNRGKSVNFAVIYGSSAYGLAFNLQIPIKDAENLLDVYWKGYPRMNQFKLGAEKMIVETKYSVTPLGRRRYFENRVLFQDTRDYVKYFSSMKREGFNHIIQGGGADITKLSMLNIYYNNPFGKDLRILMQVHDELVCEVKEEIAVEAEAFIKKCMEDAEQPFLGRIPAKVDSHVDDYWTKE